MKVGSNVLTGSGVAVLALVVAACSGTPSPAPPAPRVTATPSPAPSQSNAATPTPSPASSQSNAPTPTPSPSSVACATRPLPSSGALLYALGQASGGSEALSVDAGDFSGSSTTGYSLSNSQLNGALVNQFDNSVALDAAGNVYVGDQPANGTGQVQIYPPNVGCSGPIGTLAGSNTGLQWPQSIVVDSAGYIYVANAGATAFYSQQYGEESCPFNTITMFAPISSGTHNVAPVATIPDPAPTQACSQETSNDEMSLALDASGRIYATSYETYDVYVFPARSGSTLSSTPAATFVGGIGSTTGIVEPTGVALDAAGRVYVSMLLYGQTPNQGGTPAVAVYAANPQGTITSGPVTAIYGSQPMIGVGSLAVDRTGEVYVMARYNSQTSVLEFPPISQGSSTEVPAGTLTGTALFGAGTTVVPLALAAH